MTDNALVMCLTAAAVAAIGLIFVVRRKQKQVRMLESRIDVFHKEKTASTLELQEERAKSAKELQDARHEIKRTTIAAEEVQFLLIEQSEHFPWLASAFSDLQQLRLQREENQLRHKKRPAIASANRVAELARTVRETERGFRLTKYRIQFYEKLFPWLIELSGKDIETLINERLLSSNVDDSNEMDIDEPVRKLLSEQEWASLSNIQKYQMAFDRWKISRKSSWEIGRDFERFIGYEFEQDGYDVIYHGAIEGLEDLGRDLIAKKSDHTLIIQCKYWSQDKKIHEKHVFQTFATAQGKDLAKSWRVLRYDSCRCGTARISSRMALATATILRPISIHKNA